MSGYQSTASTALDSSTVPSQSSSRLLQYSSAPGLTEARLSSQSPPVAM